LIPLGEADIIVSIEPMESLRYLPWLAKKGWLVTNSNPFINIPDYPPVDKIIEEIKKIKNHIIIDADALAREAGSVKSVNMVMLGAASPFIEMPFQSLENAIMNFFSRKGEDVIEMNIRALNTGRSFTGR
jgi:indolepyruvate ferredoxin oxidoreductase beta subunit